MEMTGEWALEIAKRDDPQWDEAGRVHDWRNYVPDFVKVSWDELSTETRYTVIVMADEVDSIEHWE